MLSRDCPRPSSYFATTAYNIKRFSGRSKNRLSTPAADEQTTCRRRSVDLISNGGKKDKCAWPLVVAAHASRVNLESTLWSVPPTTQLPANRLQGHFSKK